MVAPVSYPKLRGRWVLPLALAGTAVGVPAIYLYLTTFSYDSPFVKAGAVLSLAYLIGYALSGPAAAAVTRLRAGAPA